MKMITYSHKDGPAGVRFSQYAKDPVPLWAVDVREVTGVKTSELQGAALDWAVAKAEGHNVRKQWSGFLFIMDGEKQVCEWKPSTAWAQGGPIIERELYSLQHIQSPEWEWAASADGGNAGYGPTPLIAAMRCYVASKLGDEAEIPEELK